MTDRRPAINRRGEGWTLPAPAAHVTSTPTSSAPTLPAQANAGSGATINSQKGGARMSGKTQAMIAIMAFALFSIFLHSWGSRESQQTLQQIHAYEGSPAAERDRRHKEEMARIAVQQKFAEAELERASRMEGKIITIPPTVLTLEQQRIIQERISQGYYTPEE